MCRAILPALLLGTCIKVSAYSGHFYHPETNYQDTTGRGVSDTGRFPLRDRRGDPYTYSRRSPFDFSDTSFIKRQVEYDPATKQYYVIEKIGSKYYRTPMTFSMQEFLQLQGKKDEEAYFRKRADLLTNLNRRRSKPAFGFSKDWVNRFTGIGKVDIRPSGYVDIGLGYQGQNIKNPTLPERARKNGGLDFPMNAQFQVDANIGDKIKLPINYNTLANFDFENQLKLDYQGRDDEVLKQFQAGNISFSSKGTLIPGAQSLFGVKTQLQFGKLYLTTVLANQRSQRQTLGMQGGSASQLFNVKADEYEENRHFLLAQYFRNNYNNWMKTLPVVNSNVQVLRMEVWVTNRTGITTDTRDVVALMDLGESNPYNPRWGSSPVPYPANNSNTLYQTLISNPNSRNTALVQGLLTATGMQPVEEFEKTFARKLQPTDYYFNPQVGFLSLNQPLQPDEVLGVAYQYTYNGQVYQVGEFSQDIPPDSTGNSQKVLFLKLLKATSQRPNLPIWDLMMKNVYGVGYGQLERQDFQLNIVYEEPSKGEKRYLPDSAVKQDFRGAPILTLVNLDRLNNQNDPQPDGVFDYVEGFTVISSQSRIVFPVLEPFGRDLEFAFPSQAEMSKYLYYPLYDTIKAIAQTYANFNRFKLVGRSKSASNTDYQLGFNIPRGSVTVTAGGQILQENVDYEINYDLGTLRVINTAIINAGLPVQVQYENNASFGLQQRNYMGLRLDYLWNKNLTVGATAVRLGERPFFTKQNYGEDPIRNSMYGVDFDYRNEIPKLTRWLDKLPFYSSKTPSAITAYGEAAMLNPGHAPQIGKGSSGAIYIDDFEGTRSSIDLRFPITSWTLSSVPKGAVDANGNILFPEADLTNDLAVGYNRAKLAWYNIEPVLQEPTNENNPLKGNKEELSKPETRQVYQREIFPQRTNDFGQALLTTFDLAYYPTEKGPYNYLADPTRINGNGNFLQPKKSWGGIMRNIDQTDFESSNIEFIEFWMQDPFINKPNSTGGELYFNLGNLSEDLLKDSRRMYENGLPTPSSPNNPVEETIWGQVPRNPIQVTNAFSNEPADRPYQDVGFDGLTDTAEVRKFQPYLGEVQANFGANAPLYQKAIQDPSADNFRGYRDALYDKANAGILARYKDINNPHGNSPVANNTDQFTSAFTLYPDQEELNRDNTLNETEEYFQYRVEIKPNMQVNTNFITDIREVEVTPVNGVKRLEKWYLFRIPVKDYVAKVGSIPDFKSVRFIRMFMTNFEDSTVMRFGKLELIRNQWRKFNYETDSSGIYTPLPANDPTSVDILAVNLEENDQREPVHYAQPPGIERQQQISNNNVNLFLNEQSLSLKVCSLEPNDARGVFKTLNLDLRQYGRLSMFIHAESVNYSDDIKNGELNAVVRIGNDFVGNFYEVKIPLNITRWGATDSLEIWPELNNLDFDLNVLTGLKSRRNSNGVTPSTYYKEEINGRSYAILGNPNLGEVRGMMLAVQNTRQQSACSEVWFNELRLSRLDEKGGYAAVGRVDLRLADLGNVTFAGSVRTRGFGTLEQRVNERSREDFKQFDLSTNLDLGKLLPKSAAIQVPVYASISKTTSTPEYDPYDLDIKLKDKINNAPDNAKDSIREDAIDELTIKTVNFTNVKKNKTNNKPVQPWDISNIDLNYSMTRQERTNPILENEELTRTRAALGYNYAPQPHYLEPLKKAVKSNSPWLALIRDFNFNYKPSMFSFKADVFRQFGAVRSRNVGGGSYKFPETYDKYFYFDRYYTMRWDLTRSLALDFNAINNARVDEPAGRIDTKDKKETVRKNLFKGGRNTHYHHDVTFTYNLPMQKLPALDWTTIRASYTARYDWIASSLLPEAKEQGNSITMGQTSNVTGEFNFDMLYNKSKYLRNIYAEVPAQPKQNGDSAKQIIERTGNQVNTVPKVFARLLTSLKRVGVQFGEDLGTLLPGYLDSTQFLGMNLKSNQPGWNYVFGKQPDTSDINKFGEEGLLTHSPLLNTLIQQRFNQKLNITAQVSPIRDLNIDINFDKTFDKQYSELYKDTSGTSGLQRYNPYAMGGFSISYISYQTLFSKFDPNEVSQTFKQFEANRIVLSDRLAKQNPYYSGNVTADGYAEGYGRYAQDVLVPAFIAAYTDKDPLKVDLIKNSNPNLRSNPFSGYVPKPNWNISYSGLSRIPGFEKVFTNFTIRHGYNSTLSMNSFNSSLLFQDPFRVGYPYFQDTLTGNFVPYFLVPNITIAEQFSPLIEMDMSFTNDLSTRFEYRKSRQLSLSLIDYQLAENRSTEFVLGMNWRKRGVPFLQNVRIGKKGKTLENDVTMRFDFSWRDDATANSKLDQNTAFGTAGQKVIRISPSIDYVMSSRINVKLYFEQNRVIPKIATSAPITTTRAGVQVRVSLAQ
ncbi:cell surface protein SprA [Chitinophagaceae bacterium LB-8]|uniref:Cell surface protein SprA n=1 Tax=Paraflavisolibacter caeni TaxID=2982496 RepID=A0A9X2XYA7_9BACT|nr:cell surface protein SprA [Paraflavisolibacter caeni]MCU7551041.1 cell surface protein SprA [Paraflavisolibacter caeni]